MNQLIESIPRINPDESGGAGCSTKEFTVFLCPIDEDSSWIISLLYESLVYDWPSPNMRGLRSETRIPQSWEDFDDESENQRNYKDIQDQRLWIYRYL